MCGALTISLVMGSETARIILFLRFLTSFWQRGVVEKAGIHQLIRNERLIGRKSGSRLSEAERFRRYGTQLAHNSTHPAFRFEVTPSQLPTFARFIIDDPLLSNTSSPKVLQWRQWIQGRQSERARSTPVLEERGRCPQCIFHSVIVVPGGWSLIRGGRRA